MLDQSRLQASSKSQLTISRSDRKPSRPSLRDPGAGGREKLEDGRGHGPAGPEAGALVHGPGAPHLQAGGPTKGHSEICLQEKDHPVCRY